MKTPSPGPSVPDPPPRLALQSSVPYSDGRFQTGVTSSLGVRTLLLLASLSFLLPDMYSFPFTSVFSDKTCTTFSTQN